MNLGDSVCNSTPYKFAIDCDIKRFFSAFWCLKWFIGDGDPINVTELFSKVGNVSVESGATVFDMYGCHSLKIIGVIDRLVFGDWWRQQFEEKLVNFKLFEIKNRYLDYK